MNVKPYLLFLLLICPSFAQDEIEGAIVAQVYHNPYLTTLSSLRHYANIMFEKIINCVKHRLINDGTASGDQIKLECAGARFQVPDKVLRQVMDKSFPVFMKIFSQRLYPLRADYEDEITHFISRVKFILKRNLLLYTSLQTAVKRSSYYVNRKKYANLMGLLEGEILILSKFQERLKKDKEELNSDIIALLGKRDADLEELRKAQLKARKEDEEEHESDESGSEEDEDMDSFVQHKMNELDEDLEHLHEGHENESEDEAMERQAGHGETEEKSKNVEYTESDFEDEPQKTKKQKKAHNNHDDHHHSYSYGKKSDQPSGYFLDDGEESPYTKMEPLRVVADSIQDDGIPGQ